jgi:hypothetical protein
LKPLQTLLATIDHGLRRLIPLLLEYLKHNNGTWCQMIDYRQVEFSSLTRSSWQPGPMLGIGLEIGIDIDSPFWSSRSRWPVSLLAAADIGGVLIWPFRTNSGLSSDSVPFAMNRVYQI